MKPQRLLELSDHLAAATRSCCANRLHHAASRTHTHSQELIDCVDLDLHQFTPRFHRAIQTTAGPARPDHETEPKEEGSEQRGDGEDLAQPQCQQKGDAER